MSDTPENIAAILAEMRGNEFDDPHLDADGIIGARRLARDWADRIEAAYKREHAAWHAETEAAKDARNRVACRMRSEFAAKCRNCPERAPGNAAAMREALEYVCHMDDEGYTSYDVHMAMQKARAALAAPARNADRFANADEARLEFQKVRGHKVWADIELWDDMDEVGAFVRWLFSPAKGGAS